uniref:FAD-binding FR-type domain-containing protein n=1 Tax=Chromera velia CCMP2878 TaxID=1169474 RepID=A0A0G4FBX9_9ALVE|eukprot:Cvel_16270.t1-p1 / transcript=Cvel_16270.t1 / gene=Cvel_16270 / organism=Chromera_velia_CCMP2878 / gene_product=Superoxide-generating NADPH oxidase heavy chain, putative / transcript_product=Superoxide-generating NADPH oxidase heavy chain, putative / location=Cvel_scaffold1245:31304-37938(-) / protein_length=868 / sequence_SO=supercontig / SO=protein_coding / is_pseudo=false
MPPDRASMSISIFEQTLQKSETGKGMSAEEFDKIASNDVWRQTCNAVVQQKMKKRKLVKVLAEQNNTLNSVQKLAPRFMSKYKMIFFGGIHTICTMVIWAHFFLEKFNAQSAAVPLKANRAWAKRVVPALEFGAMHAILFQIVLIPITMSRFTLTRLSMTKLNKIIPFEHMVEFHIHLGYVFCAIMILSVIVFFAFFGVLCQDWKDGVEPTDQFCKKFESEIMGTGYGILASTLIVMFTSYFRSRLKYEVFYYVHHLVFAMYTLALLHTLDVEFRDKGLNRSQNFRWFSGPLLFYATDRLWAGLSTFTGVKAQSVDVSDDTQAVLLNLEKPWNFLFQPGQYAFLQCPEIDQTWHPYSIGSDPTSGTLLFLIQTFGPNSWSGKLSQRVKSLAAEKNLRALTFNVQGGFGSAVQDSSHYDSVIAVGTGTGIVPMLSLMKTRYERLRLLNKEALREALASSARLAAAKNLRQYRSLDKRSLAASMIANRWRLKILKRKGLEAAYAKKTKLRVQRFVGHTVIAAFGLFVMLMEILVAGLTISWGNLKTAVLPEQVEVLQYSTLVLVTCFVGLCVYRWVSPRRFPFGFLDMLDILVICAMVIGQVIWWLDNDFDNPSEAQLTARVSLHLYRLIRLWMSSTVFTHTRGIKEDGSHAKNFVGNLSFKLVWVCRSADLVIGALPEMKTVCTDLLEVFGEGLFDSFVKMEIYCTDKDNSKLRSLTGKIEGTPLEQRVFFGRPNLIKLMKDAMKDQLIHDTQPASNNSHEALYKTLVAFCGSPATGALCGEGVYIANALALAVGQPNHHFDFRLEYYGYGSGTGGSQNSRERRRSLEQAKVDNDPSPLLVNVHRGQSVEGEPQGVVRRQKTETEGLDV